MVRKPETITIGGRTFPLTPWKSTGECKPAEVGEYNASNSKDPSARRWWNGKYWSCVYYSQDSQAHRNRAASLEAMTGRAILWRGIAVDPNKVKPK